MSDLYVERNYGIWPFPRPITGQFRTNHPTDSLVYEYSVWGNGYTGSYKAKRTPNFNRRLREGAGLLAYRFYRRFDCTASQAGHLDLWYPTPQGAKDYYTHTGNDPSIPTMETLTSMLSLLDVNPQYYVQKAAASLWDGFDIGTFLAEIHQTVDLIINAASRFRELLERALKHGLSAKDAAEKWLEWRYGWRILLYEIQSIIEALRESKPYQIFTAREGESFTFEQPYDAVVDAGSWSITYPMEDSILIGVRGTYAAQVTAPKVFVNPLVTAWELVRFSFVVDWFFSVGNALRALTGSLLSSKHTSAAGFEVQLYRRSTGEVKFNHANYYTSITGNNRFTANAVLRLRTPTPVSYLPVFKIDLNLQKLWDMLALILGLHRPQWRT